MSDPSPHPASSPRWRLRRAGLSVLAAWVAYLVLAAFAVPPIVRAQLERRAGAALGRRVTLGRVAVNPFTLTLTLEGLRVAAARAGEPDLLAVRRIVADASLASIARRALVLDALRIEGPQVALRRGADRGLSIDDIVARVTAPAPAGEAPGEPVHFALSEFLLDDGRVEFTDDVERSAHVAERISLALPFLSNIPVDVDSDVLPRFEATVDGSRVALDGTTRPFSGGRQTRFTIDTGPYDLARAWAYVAHYLPLRLASGKAALRGELVYSQPKDEPTTLVFSGHVGLDDLRLEPAAGGAPVVAWRALGIDIAEGWLLRHEVHVANVTLDGLAAGLEHPPGGGWKLAGLPEFARGDAAAPADGPGWTVKVDAVTLSGAHLALDDRAIDPPLALVLAPLDATLRGYDNAPATKAKAMLAARGDRGEALRYDGTLALDPFALDGALGVQGVALTRYAGYYAASLPVAVRAGTLDLAGHLALVPQGRGLDVRADGTSIDLAGLSLAPRGGGEAWLDLPRFEVRGAAFGLEARRAAAESVALHGARLDVLRRRDGTWNLVPPPPPAPPASAAPAGAPAAPAWTWDVGLLTLDGARVAFGDETAPESVYSGASGLALRAEGLSSDAAHAARLHLSGTFGGGQGDAKGTLVAATGAADLAVAFADVDVAPFTGYAADRLAFVVTGARFGATGRVALTPGPEHTAARFTGDARLTRCAAVDRTQGEDLFAWDALDLTGVTAASAPTVVAIGGVALSGLFARIAIDDAGRLNLRGAVSGEAAAEDLTPEQAAEAAPPPPAAPGTGEVPKITVGAVTLQGGKIDFADRHVAPPFVAALREVGGRVSGFTSEQASAGDVQLAGTYEGAAPLTITGRLNPLGAELYADLAVKVRDIELSPMSPYSGKYLGYVIEKGKLSYDAHYLVEHGRLDSKNRIFLDQLTLGAAVESKEATKLPVRLAIALLKDRNGQIDLELPVTGRLDDPRFRWGKILWKVFVNVIVKAATSPFALLGKLFSGGPALDHVDFAPGSALPDAAALETLDKLARALTERPGLRVEIAGRVDPARDAEALRRLAFERKLKAQVRRDLARHGTAPATLDEIVVPAAEREEYLRRAYKAETFPKPRNALGIARALPAEEVEKLMLAAIEVGEGDLRELTLERARAAKAALAGKGIDPARLFLVEKPAAAGAAVACRTEFSIQ